MIPHDIEICEKALTIHDFGDLADLEEKCITAEGRKFVHELVIVEYHKEEARAGML